MVAGAVLAGCLAHLAICGGRNLATLAPETTYFGASQRVLLYANQLWSHARGERSLLDCGPAWHTVEYAAACGDVQAFAHTYLRTVRILCPSLGFAVFLLLGRRRPGLKLWRPLMIVAVAVALPGWGFWLEIARASLVALAMIASVESWSRDANRAIV